MNHEELRRRAIGYALFAALAGGAWWAVTRGGPAYRELAALEARRSAIEATTRQAREHTVRSGTSALEDSIAAARSRHEALRELVPNTGAGESDADVRRLIGALAERSRVAVRSTEDAATERQGRLVVAGVQIAAEGSYHDLGRWLSAVEATRRLVQVRDVSMGSVAGATAAPGLAPGAARASAGTVTLQATFRWFRQDSTTAPPDSTMEGN